MWARVLVLCGVVVWCTDDDDTDEIQSLYIFVLSIDPFAVQRQQTWRRSDHRGGNIYVAQEDEEKEEEEEERDREN